MERWGALLTRSSFTQVSSTSRGRRRLDCLIVVGLLVSMSAIGRAREQDSRDWTDIWDEVARFNAKQEASNDGVVLEPHRVRELAVGRGDSLRSALLGALLGGENSDRALERELQILEPAGEWPLSSRESWLAVDALPAGSTRRLTAVSAMRVTPEEWKPDRISSVYRVGVEAAEDLRLEDAIAVQQPLHDRIGEEWSAFNLALSLRRLGLYQRADRVLEEQIEKSPSADLYSQRGLNSLGAGNEKRSRAYLGAALARGSADAAVILARLDLASHRMESARSGFRAVLAEDPGNAWALRGWGISLIQRPLPVPDASKDAQ